MCRTWIFNSSMKLSNMNCCTQSQLEVNLFVSPLQRNIATQIAAQDYVQLWTRPFLIFPGSLQQELIPHGEKCVLYSYSSFQQNNATWAGAQDCIYVQYSHLYLRQNLRQKVLFRICMKMSVSHLSLQRNELFCAQDCTQRWMYLYSYSPHQQNVATWTHAQDFAYRWRCSAIILTSLTSLASKTPMQMNISCTCSYLHEFLHDCMQQMSGMDVCY